MYHSTPFMLVPPGRTVRNLLIANVAVFVAQTLFGGRGGVIYDWLALSRSGLFGLRIWQFVTYTFLHGGVGHVLINMLMLYFFGRELEAALGRRAFLRLYFLSGLVAGVGWLVLSGGGAGLPSGAYPRMIGASGAVYGIMGMYAMLYPRRQITLLLYFILPVTLSARTLALGVMGLSFLLMLGESGDNVAHAAHLFGGLTGFWLGYKLRGGGGGRGGGGMFDGVRARRRRSRMHVIEGDAWEPDEPVSMDTIDALLDKIRREGIGSLTARERALLERASTDRRSR